MNITTQCYYETRSGQKAFVAGISPFYKGGIVFVGFIQGVSTPVGWYADGRMDITSECSHDLVEEWIEPVEIEGFISIIETANGEKRLTMDARGHKVLGVKRVTVREGFFENEFGTQPVRPRYSS